MAGISGGGVDADGSVQIESSTFSVNCSFGEGANVYATDDSQISIVASTIAEPFDEDCGGLLETATRGRIEVSGSIIAAGRSTACRGSVNSGGDNLFSDASCGFGNDDLSGIDPLLGPLQDNGGTTETHALLPGSPAIDAGGDDCGDADQRGVSRPQDGDGNGKAVCDIGAFEVSSSSVDLTPPSAPEAAFSHAPEYDADGTANDWYSAPLTVTYAGSVDPVNPDGSAGSGVAAYSAAQTFTRSGIQRYSGTATDAAGNVSAATGGFVNVDADAPTVTCVAPTDS
jgi:hypothetical protein